MFLKLKLNNEEDFKKKKRKTAIWVILFHIILLLLVFIIFAFKGCSIKRSPNVIQVSLSAPPAAATPSKEFLPQPEKEQKKPEKTVEKVPAKKKWKPLDPSQIKKTKKTVVKKEQKKTIKKYTPVRASDIAKNLRRDLKTIKFKNTFNANSSVLNYYDKVSQYLYNKWDQPSRAALGSSMPVVNVEISVDSAGRVINYKILKLSGINVMDSSVKKLLSSLKQLPAPPDGAMIISVSLELSD